MNFFTFFPKLYIIIHLMGVEPSELNGSVEHDHIKNLMNLSVESCDDFYEFACGNYKNIHPIPEYRGRLDFQHMVSEENYKMLDKFLREDVEDSMQKNYPSAIDKAKIFYASCLNTNAINKKGVQPLLELLEKFGGWPALNATWTKANFDWLQFLIDVQLVLGENFIIDITTHKDILYGSNELLPTFNKPTFTLKDKNLTIYAERIQETLRVLNVSENSINNITSEILDFFKDLNNLAGDIDLESILIADLTDFQTNLTKINITRLLSSVYDKDFKPDDKINCLNIQYLSALSTFLNSKTPATIVNYVLWNVIDRLMNALSDDFIQIINNFNKNLQGFSNPLPRWRICIDIILEPSVMNTATGSLFTKKMLHGKINQIQNHILELTNNIRTTIRQYLENITWFDDNIRSKALDKLDKFYVHFDNILGNDTAINLQYDQADITYDKFFESYIKVLRLRNTNAGRIYNIQSHELQWPYPLVSADAFHNALANNMALHPGILVPPFYHEDFVQFLNFGRLGIVIAHEMVHGFDINGIYFDSEGLLKPWWEEKYIKEFQKRISCYTDVITSNYSLNGQSLLKNLYLNAMEIIGDNAGMKFAYLSYKEWLRRNPESNKNEILSGIKLTPAQLFFVTVAQTFSSSIRPGAVEYELTNDPHLPDRYRVIVMMTNSQEFSDEFKCNASSAMNPENKCELF